MIVIELDDEIYYCSIMGRMGDCVGITIYKGNHGYAELCSLSEDIQDPIILQYLMFEQIV